MVTSEPLVRVVGDFLQGPRDAVILENGGVAFDLAQSKYSISGEYGKCLLHLWSAERNIVRRVVEAEVKNDVLRLVVQKLGQARPSKLEICRERDRRTPSARKAARSAYQQKLCRVLAQQFSGFEVVQLSSAMDLERSFGPIYARGLLRQGQAAFAILGVNQQETQASINAALTFAILWMNACRVAQDGKTIVEGLKLFVPSGTSALTRERMANLNQRAAKWQLYELAERGESLREIDCGDRGNIAPRRVHCTDGTAARERFAESIAHVRGWVPDCEIVILSPAEVVFRFRGLEFARALLAQDGASFREQRQIVFGVGAEERVLGEKNAGEFSDMLRRAAEIRCSHGPRHHAL